MFPYFLLIALLIFTGIISFDKTIRRINKAGFLLVEIIVILFCGSRTCGYDFAMYKLHFKHIPNFFKFEWAESHFEVGYEYLISIFKLFSDNFNYFIFFYAAISIWLLIYLCRKYSPYPLFSFFLFCGPFLFGQIMGQMRQPFANFLLYIFIIPFLLQNRKWFVFFASVIIGFCFHKSILMSSIFLPFMGKLFSKKQVVVVLSASIGCFVLSSLLQEYFVSIIPNTFLLARTAIFYLNSDVEFNLGMLERIVLFVIILYYSNKYQLYKSSKLFRILLNIFGLGFVLYITLIHVSAEFAVRGTNGLYLSVIFIFPLLIKRAVKIDKIILIIGAIMWSSYLLISFILRQPEEYDPYTSFLF